MHHVNKRFSGENKVLYCIYFSIFILIIFIIDNFKQYKEPEKQIEHEVKVQSDIDYIDIIWNLNELPLVTYNDKHIVYFDTLLWQDIEFQEEIQEEVKKDIKEEIEVSKPEPKELPKENKIYYVQDEGYCYYLSEEYQDYLWEICKEYQVTEYYELFIAQMYHESHFDESIISSTNDYGLMQINKCNHSWLEQELGNGDFLDPYNNIEAGIMIMSGFLQKYSDVHKSLVCYNRGEKEVINGTYSSSYSECIISDMNKLIEINREEIN